MTDKQHRIQSLIHSIITYLKVHQVGTPGVDIVLDKLADMNLSGEKLIDMPPQGTRHDKVLRNAMDGILAPELQDIARCLKFAKNDVVWSEDNAQFYSAGTNLGEGYTRCNLHTSLIGPDACGYHNPDFNLGIFMLGPRTLYRDHNHDAPELYLNLSEKSGWRFGECEWQDYRAGSLIWNEAGDLHATRVYDQPFISVFVWLENVNSCCNLVHRDDWAEIEKDLAKQAN